MRIAIAITNQLPLQLPKGVVFASIPLHFIVAEGLVRRGHEVTMFCSEDTVITPPMKKESFGLTSVYQLKKDNPGKAYSYKYLYASDMIMFSEMYRMANEGAFDLIWNNDPTRVAPLTNFTAVPTLFTLHDPLDRSQYHLLPFLQKKNKNHWYVSISNAQRVPLPELEYRQTIYHGIDVSDIPYCDTPDDYFVFFGRIIPAKGVLDSIEVAKKAGVKLKVIGPYGSESPEIIEYSDKVRREVDNDRIEYLGEMQLPELLQVVAKSKGFINMVDIWESFGMVLIESMATGTPVIARRRGSIPEVIAEGETGFVIDTIDEAVEAVKKIDEISRRACRDRVERHFGVERFVTDYEVLMTELVQEAARN